MCLCSDTGERKDNSDGKTMFGLFLLVRTSLLNREGDNDNGPRMVPFIAHASFVFKIDSPKTQCLLIALNKMQLLKR